MQSFRPNKKTSENAWYDSLNEKYGLKEERHKKQLAI